MPKRAWCNGCRSYVMLTAEDICPYGHPKPSLRAVEEVGYGAPPSKPELGGPADSSQSSGGVFAPATSTASATFSGAATYGGDTASTSYGSGYGSSYGSAGPTSSYAAAEPLGGYGAPAPAAAVAAPAAAWQPSPSGANPWQSDIDHMSIDPMLQMQLNKDAAGLNREVSWMESWAGIIIFLFILWPAGLIFLWRSPLPTSTQKWTITGVIGALVAINLIRVMLVFSAASAAVHR